MATEDKPDDWVLALLIAQAEAWNECVAWFARLGPLNDHQRISGNTLSEAEEANPFVDMVNALSSKFALTDEEAAAHMATRRPPGTPG